MAAGTFEIGDVGAACGVTGTIWALPKGLVAEVLPPSRTCLSSLTAWTLEEGAAGSAARVTGGSIRGSVGPPGKYFVSSS